MVTISRQNGDSYFVCTKFLIVKAAVFQVKKVQIHYYSQYSRVV